MNLVIDGSNLLHRSYWVAETRSPLVNSKGVWTGPVFIFLKSLKSLTEKFKPEHIWVTWDKRVKYPSTNFRKQLLPEEYKQNRNIEKNKKVHEQHEFIKTWLEDLGVYQIYPYVLEADDVISWLVTEKVIPSTIVTIDKDLLQLVNKHTDFYNPLKKQLITVENFEEIIEVPLKDFLKTKALMGDKSDNITGVPSYGPQKSKKLAQNSYDEILQKLTEDEQNTFKKNYLLMDLKYSYDKEEHEKESYEQQFIEQKRTIFSDIEKFKQKCEEFEMFSFLKNIQDWQQTFMRSQNLNRLIAQLM